MFQKLDMDQTCLVQTENDQNSSADQRNDFRIAADVFADETDRKTQQGKRQNDPTNKEQC